MSKTFLSLSLFFTTALIIGLVPSWSQAQTQSLHLSLASQSPSGSQVPYHDAVVLSFNVALEGELATIDRITFSYDRITAQGQADDYRLYWINDSGQAQLIGDDPILYSSSIIFEGVDFEIMAEDNVRRIELRANTMETKDYLQVTLTSANSSEASISGLPLIGSGLTFPTSTRELSIVHNWTKTYGLQEEDFNFLRFSLSANGGINLNGLTLGEIVSNSDHLPTDLELSINSERYQGIRQDNTITFNNLDHFIPWGARDYFEVIFDASDVYGQYQLSLIGLDTEEDFEADVLPFESELSHFPGKLQADLSEEFDNSFDQGPDSVLIEFDITAVGVDSVLTSVICFHDLSATVSPFKLKDLDSGQIISTVSDLDPLLVINGFERNIPEGQTKHFAILADTSELPDGDYFIEFSSATGHEKENIEEAVFTHLGDGFPFHLKLEIGSEAAGGEPESTQSEPDQESVDTILEATLSSQSPKGTFVSGLAEDLLKYTIEATDPITINGLVFTLSPHNVDMEGFFLLDNDTGKIYDDPQVIGNQVTFPGLSITVDDEIKMTLMADTAKTKGFVQASLTTIQTNESVLRYGIPLLGYGLTFSESNQATSDDSPVPELYQEPEVETEPETDDSSSNTQQTRTRERVIAEVVERERSRVKATDQNLVKRVKGNILLQVESVGEAWYVDPVSSKRHYLQDGTSAYQALRELGLGIKNSDLAKIPVGIESRFQALDSDSDGLADQLEIALGTDPYNPDSDNDGFNDGTEVRSGYSPLGKGKLVHDQNLVNNLSGRIVLQVESHGEAWYINPNNGRRYYMKDGEFAYQVMRFLSLGITNDDLSKIPLK
ncbi:thrombospondin type 3 repeat-containing protein [Patescibacteria group bacterium]